MKIENIYRAINVERTIENAQILNTNGMEISKVDLIRVIEEIYRYEYNSYSVRGHVRSLNFNVSFEGGMLSFERLSNDIFVGNNAISYQKFESVKIFISNSNWIDISIQYDDNSYAHIVIVPK